MIHAATFLLALAGFALLLFAMPRHHRDWLGRKLAPARGRALRLCSIAALVAAFAVASAGFGWGYGAVLWLGWLTMAAAVVVTVNTDRERIVMKVRG